MSLLFLVILLSIVFGIVSDIECLHTILFTLGTVFQLFKRNLLFSKNRGSFYFAWLFTALQFSSRTNLGLYKMTNNSI